MVKHILLSLIVALTLSCSRYDHVIIVKNNNSNAVIVIPGDASEHLRSSADILTDYIQKSTGAELPVVTSSSEKDINSIYLFEGEDADTFDPDIGNMDGDGFIIAVPDRNTVVIAGPTSWGTEYGVYEFLERYVGVRWLMPGEFGADIPQHRSISVPGETVREEPVYLSRQLSAPNGTEFARRNRHHPRVSFHHHLLYLFPPDTYTKNHPEFYPIRDGKRYLPEASDHHWQPCFSEPGTVKEAIKNIKEYFRTHPEATSYSLGMNDSDHFCQCDRCLEKEGPEKNFLGHRNYADIYFEWANKVVEGVLETYPDKWFGTLAYWSLAEPPRTVKVHPRIIPYLTYGRIRWFDPELEAQGHQITEWWRSVSPTLGWYDYIYGSPYMVPRVFFHQMADYLRYSSETGVGAYYGEIYYNWGEGPKEYLTLKLLWDPDIDVDAELNDWYVHAVGKDAAPELKAYYDHWEQFWTSRIRESDWYSKENTWMQFNHPGYFDIVTEDDIALSRKWLEAAVAKAVTENQKKRAGILLRAFEYYEASAYTFIDEIKAYTIPVSSGEAAVGMLETVERYGSMKEKHRELEEAFESDPVLHIPNKSDRYRQTTGDRWGCYPLWATYEWAHDSTVSARVDELTSSPVKNVRSHAQLMQAVLNGTALPLTDNASFSTNHASWDIIANETETVKWINAGGHASRGALLVSSPDRFKIEQTVPLSENPHLYTALAFVKLTGPDNVKGTAELVLSVIDKRDMDFVVDEWSVTKNWMKSSIRIQKGIWTPIATTIDVSEIKADLPPDSLTVQLSLNGFDEGSDIIIDDVGIYAH